MGLSSLFKGCGAGLSLFSLQFPYSFATKLTSNLVSTSSDPQPLDYLDFLDKILMSYRIHDC